MAFDTLISASEETTTQSFPIALAKDKGKENAIAYIVGNTYNEWYTYVKGTTLTLDPPLIIEAKDGRWKRVPTVNTGDKTTETLLALQPVHANLNNWGTMHDLQGRYITTPKGDLIKFP